ncbi:MAG: stage III sporulation protein AC [Clostridia bacterium]
MDIDLLFKIAGIGILVSVINLVLTKSGREEIAMLTTITGLIIVLMLVVVQIGDLFDVVKNVFRL